MQKGEHISVCTRAGKILLVLSLGACVEVRGSENNLSCWRGGVVRGPPTGKRCINPWRALEVTLREHVHICGAENSTTVENSLTTHSCRESHRRRAMELNWMIILKCGYAIIIMSAIYFMEPTRYDDDHASGNHLKLFFCWLYLQGNSAMLFIWQCSELKGEKATLYFLISFEKKRLWVVFCSSSPFYVFFVTFFYVLYHIIQLVMYRQYSNLA